MVRIVHRIAATIIAVSAVWAVVVAALAIAVGPANLCHAAFGPGLCSFYGM